MSHSNDNNPIMEEENWQLNLTSLKERCFHLMGKQKMSDMTFIVGINRTRIPAHKLFLAATSDVFYNVLYLMEPDNMELRVVDVEVPIFMKFLEYVYSGEIVLTNEIVADLWKLADRYEIPHLVNLCVDYFLENITIDNCLKVLEKCKDATLRLKCLAYIAENLETIIKQEFFLNTSLPVIKEILELPVISCSEFSLYEAIDRWTDRECFRQKLNATIENKRKILGDVFFLIRFPTMTMDEVTSCITDYNLLTKEEFFNLHLFFLGKLTESMTFNATKRKSTASLPSIRNKNLKSVVIVNEFVSTQRFVEGFQQAIFSVNKSIYLLGVGIAVPVYGNFSEVKSTIAIYRWSRNSWKIHKRIEEIENQSIPLYTVPFSIIRLLFAPVIIEANQKYRILVKGYQNNLRRITGVFHPVVKVNEVNFSFEQDNACSDNIAVILFNEECNFISS